MNYYIYIRSVGQIKICGCTNEERCQVNEEPCEERKKGQERKEINSSKIFRCTHSNSITNVKT